MNHRDPSEIDRSVHRDWRTHLLWNGAKFVFGALVLWGLGNAGDYLHKISDALTTQMLDHQTLGGVQKTQEQLLQTQNQLILKATKQGDLLEYLNAQQKKDDAFREAHGSKG